VPDPKVEKMFQKAVASSGRGGGDQDFKIQVGLSND
jgi:hypothetical protein